MGTISSYTSGVKITSVSKLMQTLAYRDNRFISLFINPTPAGTKKDPNVKDPGAHKWVNERLNSARGILNANITAAATTVYVDNKYLAFVANKSYITIDDEVILVTAATLSNNTWTLTVTRGALSTTAATHTAGALVKVQRVWEEGADASVYDNDKGEFGSNVCQIFRTDVKITGSAKETKTYNNENDIDRQIIQKVPMLFQQMENACFNTNAPYSSTDTRIMAGLPYYVASDMKKDNGGNAFSLDKLADDVEELAFNGVNPENLFLVAGRGVLASINAYKELIVRESMKVRDLDYNLNTIIVPGKNKVTIAPLCQAVNPNEYYLFDKDSVQFKFFRALDTEDLAKTGDSERKMVVSEATLECHNWAQGGALRRINVA